MISTDSPDFNWKFTAKSRQHLEKRLANILDVCLEKFR